MSYTESNPDEQILAYVCGCLTREEQAAFVARMVDDPKLARRVEAVRRGLAPLASWQAPAPDASAVDAIMQRVATTTPLEYVATTAPLEPVLGGSSGRRLRFTLPQFFAVAASIAIVLSIVFPTIQMQRNRQMQTACLGNMHQIGRAVQNYAAAYDGALPRIASPPQMVVNWLRHPQRQQFKPMIRVGFVVPSVMVCPTSFESLIDDQGATRDLDAFLGRIDLRFYSVQHPAGGPQRLAGPTRMAIVGDENPLFAQGSSAEEFDANVNSRAHRGRGQSVLFSDGSAEFLRSPRLPDADNIWRAEDVQTYTGTEAPTSATDSFLIP